MPKEKQVQTKIAAEMLGVSVDTVWNWFHKGKLPGVYGPYCFLYFDVDDIKKIKEERKRDAQTWTSLKDLCKSYEIDKNVVLGHIRSGRIPFHRNELGHYRFRIEEIERWLGERENWGSRWFTSKEASRFLGLSHEKIMVLTENGVLPGYPQENGHPRFLQSEIKDWFENLGMRVQDPRALSENSQVHLRHFRKWLHREGYAISTIRKYWGYTRRFLSWYANSFEPLLEGGVIASGILERYEIYLASQYSKRPQVINVIIGLRPFFRWAVEEGVIANSPFNPLTDIMQFPDLDNWLVDRGFRWGTIKSHRGNLRTFARWFHEARRAKFSPAAATPENFKHFWAYMRLVKRYGYTSRNPMRTPLLRFSSFGVDTGKLASDPWTPLSTKERSLQRRYENWLSRTGYSTSTTNQRMNAFLNLCEWYKIKKGKTIDPPTLSMQDVKEFSIYLEVECGLSIFTRRSHLNGARVFMDWAGKLPKRSQYLKLDPRLRRRMKDRISRLLTQENLEEVRKLETLLFLAKGRTLHETSRACGPARSTIRKWVLELAEDNPSRVQHQVR